MLTEPWKGWRSTREGAELAVKAKLAELNIAFFIVAVATTSVSPQFLA